MGVQTPSTDIVIQEKFGQILDLLRGEYGIPEWEPDHDPVSGLIQTILSQNTSDTNSRRAYQSLRSSVGRWEDIINEDISVIAHHIRGGGLGRIKAQRIRQALSEVVRKRGRLELDFLGQLSLFDAQEWLRELPGVGLKTACCVLLFSLGMPALPVDTHIQRVSKRLGLIDARATLDQAHLSLGETVPSEDVYQFHVLLIEHGRRICQARQPKCHACALKGLCPSYT